MTRPETPYEAVSYDLNKFRERRMADRRFIARDSADRRVPQSEGFQPPTTENKEDDFSKKID